ncbi:hypothetical protein NQ317_000200 [Molorchus minor]|uniref:Small ribosomal subunit protein bS16m n=1 Tax=Molorchus minor TaxID=1323400 RepID=A0ABQ9JCS6_9CUCU|nr:hypothetical protein NQ317_000200 [Molorchus minor]
MIIPASGTGIYSNKTAKIIRFVRKGCTNRPFFHITVTERHMPLDHPGIEQLGTYDPLPNQWNEKLISLNYERVRYWIGNGAHLSNPVEQLLGLAESFPYILQVTLQRGETEELSMKLKKKIL